MKATETVDEIAERLRPAIEWLASTPDEETLVQAMLLRFLLSRGAVDEATMVPNPETENFCEHVRKLATDAMMLNLIAKGVATCECSGEEPKYWITEAGRKTAEHCKA